MKKRYSENIINMEELLIFGKEGSSMNKIFIFIFVTVFCSIHVGFACELKVRVNETSYPPFFMEIGKGAPQGLSIELVEALLAEAGCRPVYEPLPWKRALAFLKTGQIHMMLNMTPTEERKEFAYFIGPQLDETVVFVVPKDSDYAITSLDDFKKLPKPLGIELGRVYGKEFEEKMAKDEEFKKNIEDVNSMALNENKTAAGRLSGFLGYGYNVYYSIKTDPIYQNFKVHPYVVNKDYVYFGFSKESVSKDMLQRLQDAYDRAQKKGLFEAIKKKYQ